MNKPQQWIFTVVYLLTMICYMGVETGDNHRVRSVNKIILSSLFLINSAINILFGRVSLNSIILLCGIFHSWLGDVLLLSSVAMGGCSFAMANGLYLIYMFRTYFANNPQWLSIAAILYALCIAVWAVMVKSGYLQLGKMKVFSAYILGVCMPGCCGLTLLFTTAPFHLKMIGLGLGLVMISDFLLASHYYHDKDRKMVLRMNSSSYFIGMMIVSLMTYMINH